MKTNLLSLMLISAIAYACQTANSSTTGFHDLEKEKKEIMAVIESETDCFFKRDYNCWQNQFAHSDYSYQAWSNADGTFDASVGWDNINKNLGKFIKENPKEKEEAGNSHPIVKRENIRYKFYGNNAAHLTWDQYNSDRDQKYFLQSKEVRLMEKVNGQWKIVNVSAFWNYKDKIPLAQIQ